MHGPIIVLALIGFFLITLGVFTPNLVPIFGSSQQIPTNIILFGVGVGLMIPLPFAFKH